MPSRVATISAMASLVVDAFPIPEQGSPVASKRTIIIIIKLQTVIDGLLEALHQHGELPHGSDLAHRIFICFRS